ncbi:Hypothetical protein A7982_11097 [Minicystis rosea]|nr:Hypothetical protein A7982_11097 [Minicystis rosea]
MLRGGAVSSARAAITVEALRRAFDERFAEPITPHVEARERFLLVDVGGARVALRVAELAGIHAAGKIVRVPGGAPGLLGITGIRGRVAPVFDLAALLDVAPSARARRFLVLAGPSVEVALLIAEMEGWVEIARTEVRAVVGDAGGPHATEIIAVAGAHVPILSIPSVLREIAERTPRGGVLP